MEMGAGLKVVWRVLMIENKNVDVFLEFMVPLYENRIVLYFDLLSRFGVYD